MLDKLYHLISQQFEGVSLMTCFLLGISGALILQFAMTIYRKLTGKKVRAQQKVKWFLLLFYLIFVFQMTYYRREAGSRDGVELSLEDVFTSQITARQILYQILNVILFIPYGAILTGILQRVGMWKRLILAVGFSYLLSLIIEMAQLVTQRGYFEVADLLMNVIGGLLGCLMMVFVEKVRRH